ncbi:MAG TPA: Ppx/GppA phosphatase family protein [Solirubrobacteraceae bacterium]|nr:Ppx/GppA phosphatase family protein [Solirubrobacteraceae bacterium]
MRIAVVDIGTNSTRLLICDVEQRRVTDELERRTLITRLGAGVDADGSLNEEAMNRVYAALDEYKQLIDKHGAERAVAVLTSAVRDAANGRQFADTVEQRYGITPHVLSGDEEAGLTFRGATSERDPDDRTPTLVFDIGGGSTELVIGSGHEMSFHVSTQAGVVRQTERCIQSDPPTGDELEHLRQDVRKILSDAVPEDHRRSVQHAIGVAGTATSVAAIAQELDPYDPAKVHGYRLDREECVQILQRLASIPLEERRRVPGLHPDRAPTIVAGVIILIEVLDLFDLHEVEVSEHDILRGAALAFGE